MQETIAKIINKDWGVVSPNDFDKLLPSEKTKWLETANKILSAIAGLPNESMFLTDDEIFKAQKLAYSPDKDEVELFRDACRMISQAQLAKCTPLIEARARKEERLAAIQCLKNISKKCTTFDEAIFALEFRNEAAESIKGEKL